MLTTYTFTLISAATEEKSGGSFAVTLLFMAAIGGAMYLLVIRPRRRRLKESQPTNSVSSTPWASPSSGEGQTFKVMAYGVDDRVYTMLDLQQMAKAKVITPTTMVQSTTSQYPVQASQIPGVFSDKSYTTALILSVFLGALGIDRFYLGYTGLGIAKLLTFGGCGIWALIDLVLIAMRNVPDSDGRPLS